MPELPEVETIRAQLVPHVLGRTFTGIKITDTRPLQNLKADEFCQRLIGRKITGLERRGKYLVFNLSGGRNLIVHLRMTGSLLWNPHGKEPFTRLEFQFEGGVRMVYTDVRRFGTMYLTRDASKITDKLGAEPLSGEFTPALMEKIFSSRSTPIKTVLLNQNLIAGIGNMYADEALWVARIHPLRPASSLGREEILRLNHSIKIVLEKAIRNKGASVRNYRGADGAAGRAQTEFAVAHRQGERCPRCGTSVARIVVGQRGTYYCPKCQTSDNIFKKVRR